VLNLHSCRLSLDFLTTQLQNSTNPLQKTTFAIFRRSVASRSKAVKRLHSSAVTLFTIGAIQIVRRGKPPTQPYHGSLYLRCDAFTARPTGSRSQHRSFIGMPTRLSPPRNVLCVQLWMLNILADSFPASSNVSSPCRRHEKSSPLQDLHQASLRTLHFRMWSYILLFG
jgi:hypothetical protein